MSAKIELEKSAEHYPPTAIPQLKLVGRASSYLEYLIKEIQRVEKGLLTFKPFIIKGMYGSGKTYFARKLCYEVLKRTERTIPIHLMVFTGGIGFKPFKLLTNYSEAINRFVEEGAPAPFISGSRDDWKDRKSALEEAVRGAQGQRDLERFFSALELMNKNNWYPLVIIDEFETTLVTRVGLRDDESKEAYVEFLESVHPLIRGAIFRGSLGICTTSNFSELIEKSIRVLGYHDLIQELESKLRAPISVNPRTFPLENPAVSQVFGRPFDLNWDFHTLNLLCKEFGLLVHERILKLISDVLPTPRAIIDLIESAKRLGIEGVVTESDFFHIIKDRYEEFEKGLKVLKDSRGRFIVGPQSKWPNRFRAMLEAGMLRVTRGDYLRLAKIWGYEGEERKVKQKVSNTLRGLSDRGLLSRTGTGEWSVDKYIVAYLLGIDRLPSGEGASLEVIMSRIRHRVEETRAARRKGSRLEVKEG